MGQGGYVFCEWDSVAKEYPNFQASVRNLENLMIQKCNMDWAPKTFGALTPNSGQYGRTSILPELFETAASVNLSTWRIFYTTSGHQTLLQGTAAGNTIPEDIKVAWYGLAFPNQQQHITEIRFQIGDRKYGRINLEVMKSYNKPALVFEEGLIIDEETSFHLYGFVEGPIVNTHDGLTGIYQRIVMLGAAYFKRIDKVLGTCGAVIT